MAEGTSLKLKFDTMSGSRTWTFRRAKPSAGLANIKALGQAMIDNGEIYESRPVTLVSAIEVTTSENVYDLS